MASFVATLGLLGTIGHGRATPSSSAASSAGRWVDPQPYREAADAARKGDFPEARQQLSALVEKGGPASLEARVVFGLLAHEAGEYQLAKEQLIAAEGYGDELEDWRLWALAESALQTDDYDTQTKSLRRLLSNFPHSHLFAPATVRLTEGMAERGDWLAVADAASRYADNPALDAAARDRLATLHWQAALALDLPRLRRAVAKRLLVEHPLRAADLQAVEEFRLTEGAVPWAEFLNGDELTARARSLLRHELTESALDTLDQVRDHDRDFSWHLVRAQALTAAEQGTEALELLTAARPQTLADVAQLEWQRAQAALEVATPRPHRDNLDSEGRAQMRRDARTHLQRIAELNIDRPLTKRALSLLFDEFLDAEQFEAALSTLTRLLALDSDDTTGARPLWKLGWHEYSQRNYSGAVGYWTHLSRLYPKSNYNRAGSYWSARAHQQLGHLERAADLFRELIDVPIVDFYGRHARRHLDPRSADGAAASAKLSIPAGPVQPWPIDSILARAERLQRLGLSRAALQEVEALADRANRRAVAAQRATILASLGERRRSIAELRRAFPLLGTPHQHLIPQEALHLYYPLDYQGAIERFAARARVPVSIIFGMIRQESAFDPQATSWAGARGLMQIMPATGRELARKMGLRYGTDRLTEPEFSIQLGTTYYSQVLRMFDENQELALAGYNAGPYRIKRLWRQAGPNAELDRFLEELELEETKSYVKRVLLYSNSYRSLYQQPG